MSPDLQQDKMYNHPLALTENDDAISHTKANGSPGPDGILLKFVTYLDKEGKSA